MRTPGLSFVVSRASASAIAAVETLGGTVVARYYNKLTLKAAADPDHFLRKGRPVPGMADPVSRREILYYADWDKHRGYLGLLHSKEATEELLAAAAAAAEEDAEPDAQPSRPEATL